jgi:hypothetical protein
MIIDFETVKVLAGIALVAVLGVCVWAWVAAVGGDNYED